jgi:GGDEF domain-containing protein
MENTQYLIWSAQSGALAMLLAVSFAVANVHRSLASGQQVAWLAASCFMNIAVNGFLRTLVPALSDGQAHVLQVAVGPLVFGLSALWLRNWLDLRRRSLTMDRCLLGIAIAALVGGVACFALDVEDQFAASGMVAFATCMGIAVMCLWAGMRGDRLSLFMAVSTLIVATATALEYSMANGASERLDIRALSALLIVVGTTLISVLLWLRSHKEYESLMGNMVSAQLDPATRLYNGRTLVHKISEAQNRLRMLSGDGAVVAVVVSGLSPLAQKIGTGGVHELLIRAGARVRREAGLINPVGRYFDACFVVLIETLSDPSEVDRLVHLLTKSLSRPMEIRGVHGEPQTVTLNIGVGAARLFHQSDISSVLHRAEQSARSANGSEFTESDMQWDSQPSPMQNMGGVDIGLT